MILLDTSAVLFLLTNDRRARRLESHLGGLAFSPVSLLELHFLQESGRGAFTAEDPARAVREDPRWTVDDPPLEEIVLRALPLVWTRDPFDRLLVGHALYRRWRLATSDSILLRNLPSSATFAL